MLNSKLIDILKTFSQEEIKRFDEFLISPFHNKNKKAILLFKLISKYHPEFENKSLTKEKLFEKIFAGENSKYNDASIRNLLSDLMILSEKFLSYSRFEKDRFEFNEQTLRELIDRKLTGVFEKKLKITEDAFHTGYFEGEEQFYKQFIIEELKSSSIQFSDNLKLYKDNSNLKASEYLSFFYLIKIFKMVNFFEFQKMYNIKHDLNIAEKILSELDLEKLTGGLKKSFENKNYDILIVYYKMYRAITNPSNDEYYFEFKKILIENDNLFSLLERYGLYVCLTNSCVQKIDMGRENFSKECFEVYEIMIGKDLFAAYPGYFPLAAFSAIVNVGLTANEFEKVERIIHEYSDKLNPAHKEDAMNFSLAKLNFQAGNFSRALEYVSKTDTEFSIFKFHLKILSLKIYFELEDYESLYYTIDSFRHFLNKNKIVGENYKKEFSDFIKILDLLIKYKSINDKKIYFTIKQLLENKAIASKGWLLKKFGELKF